MKSNPKTIAGVAVLVVLAVALGFLLSHLIPTAGEVRREIGRVVTLPGHKKHHYEHMVQRHYAILV